MHGGCGELLSRRQLALQAGELKFTIYRLRITGPHTRAQYHQCIHFELATRNLTKRSQA